jgi:hypothetical protein
VIFTTTLSTAAKLSRRAQGEREDPDPPNSQRFIEVEANHQLSREEVLGFVHAEPKPQIISRHSRRHGSAKTRSLMGAEAATTSAPSWSKWICA